MYAATLTGQLATQQNAQLLPELIAIRAAQLEERAKPLMNLQWYAHAQKLQTRQMGYGHPQTTKMLEKHLTQTYLTLIQAPVQPQAAHRHPALAMMQLELLLTGKAH